MLCQWCNHSKYMKYPAILATDLLSKFAATCRYIKWAQEQFAANGSKAELQQVLEAATRSLSSTNRYNSDVRLLRIWVQYVSTMLAGLAGQLHMTQHPVHHRNSRSRHASK
jgi:hypothetical protein